MILSKSEHHLIPRGIEIRELSIHVHHLPHVRTPSNSQGIEMRNGFICADVPNYVRTPSNSQGN